MRIDTPRLSLLLSDPDMAASLADYLRRNRKHFANSGPKQAQEVSELRAREQLQSEVERFRAGTCLHWYLFELGRAEVAGTILGNVSLTQIIRGVFQACYLGYRIDLAYEGKGFMREALQPILAHAFTGLGLHRVMANYVPTNERSGRLLKSLGFVVEGYARDYLMLNGRWQDHILTSLVAPDTVS